MGRKWRGRRKTHAPSKAFLETQIVSLTAARSEQHRKLADALDQQERREKQQAELVGLLDRLQDQGQVIRIFGISLGYTRAVRSQIRSLRAAIRAGDKDIRAGEAAEVFARQRLTSITSDHAQTAAALDSIKLKEEQKREREALAAKRERDRQARHDANASLAARVRGEVRSESARLRQRLRRDHPCPYCGGDLGPDMHADHIHPVAKGGLPVESNYVMVCQPCNQAKRDFTLNQFIDRMGFDRETVIRALRALGKDA